MKKKIKGSFKLFLSALFFLVLSFFIVLNIYGSWQKIRKIKQEKDRTEKEIIKLKQKEEKLNSDVEKLKNPEYVARYLREKFLYSKEGEYIIRIPKGEA